MLGILLNLTYQVNDLIKKSANSYSIIYSSIIENNEKLLNFYETVFNEKNDFSTKEGTWRRLPMTTEYSTYTLIDQNRTIDGKLAYLTINSNERKQLINKLESVFGDKVKGGVKAGQLPVEVSASVLWKALNDS